MNGNYRKYSKDVTITIVRPHSLGQSVEWKPEKKPDALNIFDTGPTRWGNQLNGNAT